MLRAVLDLLLVTTTAEFLQDPNYRDFLRIHKHDYHRIMKACADLRVELRNARLVLAEIA